jgi:type IV pilus assembly protein PilM
MESTMGNLFGQKKKSVVGLDIGSSALKAVELKPVRGGFELLHVAHQNLQPDIIVDGHIIDLNHVSDCINRVWADHSIKTSQVATSLSGHAVIVKKITLPAMSEEELDEQIHWEAEQYIPFDINDVNLYHEIIGMDSSGQNMDVLLVACKRDKIAQFTQVISQAGKQPVIVDVDAFALQNAYEANYHPSPNQTVALLDIGASVMTINIVRGTTSVFARDISAGGNQYTDLLQKELNLTFEQAEAVKRGADVDPNLTAEQAQPSIQSVSEMIGLEIQRTLDFFRSTAEDSSAIDRMLIAGGSSKVARLTDYLSDKFQMPVERFDSFRSIKFDRKRFDDEYLGELSPNMAVAVGLAVRVAEEAK